MATQKISQTTWDSISREILRDSEGITNLVHNVLHMSYDHPRKPLSDLAVIYCYEGNCLTVWDKDKYLDKHKIPYRDADKKFDKVYGQAINYLIVQYMKKHKLGLASEKDRYGNTHLVLVKRD